MDTRQRDVIKEERKETKWNAQRERVRVRVRVRGGGVAGGKHIRSLH